MRFDPERVGQNASRASNQDLLDRLTAYRDGLEPDAIPIIEGELRKRGIGSLEIDAYRRKNEENWLKHPDGSVAMCSFCRRPAVAQGWGWFRLWRLLPIFPKNLRTCQEHAQRADKPV